MTTTHAVTLRDLGLEGICWNQRHCGEPAAFVGLNDSPGCDLRVVCTVVFIARAALRGGAMKTVDLGGLAGIDSLCMSVLLVESADSTCLGS